MAMFSGKKTEDATSSICSDNKMECIISVLSMKFMVHYQPPCECGMDRWKMQSTNFNFFGCFQ